MSSRLKEKPISGVHRWLHGRRAAVTATLAARHAAAGLVTLGPARRIPETEPELWRRTGRPAARRAILTIYRAAPAVLPAGPQPAVPQPGWCRWRTAPTAPVPSACRPRIAAWSASNRPACAPRWGRISLKRWPACPYAHALTRTLRDSAALLDATHGPEAGDPYAVPPPPGSF